MFSLLSSNRNLPFYIGKYLFTSRDDLFENLEETTILACQMFTSGFRPRFKNGSCLTSLTYKLKNTLTYKTTKMNLRKTSLLISLLHFENLEETTILACQMFTSGFRPRFKNGSCLSSLTYKLKNTLTYKTTKMNLRKTSLLISLLHFENLEETTILACQMFTSGFRPRFKNGSCLSSLTYKLKNTLTYKTTKMNLRKTSLLISLLHFENLEETTILACQMFTSGFRPRFKNGSCLTSLTYKLKNTLTYKTTKMNLRKTSLLISLLHFENLEETTILACQMFTSGFRPRFKNGSCLSSLTYKLKNTLTYKTTKMNLRKTSLLISLLHSDSKLPYIYRK